MADVSEHGAVLSALVHIGTGGQSRLEDYLSRHVSRVVMVEPVMRQASLMMARLADNERVQVVRALVGTNGGDAELRCWNMERLASVREAAPQLNKVFPDLSIVSRERVPVLTPAELLVRAGIRPSLLHLVLEYSGDEQHILEAWQAHGLLDKTSCIEIRLSEDPLFQGAKGKTEIEAWLANAGFAVVERDTSDPHWPVLKLEMDVVGRALKAAEQRIAALDQAFAEAEAAQNARKKALARRETALDAAEERAAKLEKALTKAAAAEKARSRSIDGLKIELNTVNERVRELEGLLTDAVAAREAQVHTLAERDVALTGARERAAELENTVAETRAALDARNAALAERDAALQAAEERAGRLEKSLAEARAAFDAQTRQLEEADASFKTASERAAGLEKVLAERDVALTGAGENAAELEKTVAETRAALDARNAALAERDAALQAADERAGSLEKSLAEARAALAKAEQEYRLKLDKAQSDLGFATRLQGLLQSDLVDLRARLQVSEQQRAQHEALLRKLTPCLQQAADHLRQTQPFENLVDVSSIPTRQPRAKSGGSSLGQTRRRKGGHTA